MPLLPRRTPAGTVTGLALALAVMAGCDSSPTAPVFIPPISAVVVSPDTASIQIGGAFDFDAVAFDTLASPLPGVPLEWTTGNSQIASVDGNGIVRGVGEGWTPVFVEVGGKRDTAWALVSFAQSGWFVQYHDASGGAFNAIGLAADGRTGAAVGEVGRIVRTTNAGATWTGAVSNTAFTLQAVCFTSATEAWAVGYGGTVLRTTNSGSTWSRLVNVPASENLYDVHFATRDTGWVVGASGVILRTFDRGASWQRLNPTSATLRSVSFAGRDGWAVGTTGAILGTHDRGLSWFTVTPAVTSSDLLAVWRRSESKAWAAGEVGVAPRTVVTLDSTAWELRNTGASNRLGGVHFPDDQIGFAVGFNAATGGIVLRTDDGGVSWTPQSPSLVEELLDVFFVDENRGWAVSVNGRIIHTSDGGGP